MKDVELPPIDIKALRDDIAAAVLKGHAHHGAELRRIREEAEAKAREDEARARLVLSGVRQNVLDAAKKGASTVTVMKLAYSVDYDLKPGSRFDVLTRECLKGAASIVYDRLWDMNKLRDDSRRFPVSIQRYDEGDGINCDFMIVMSWSTPDNVSR